MTPAGPGRPADSRRPAGSVIPGRPAVLIMAKAPRPGTVKTRLHPMLSPDGCAALAERLIRHAASVAAGVDGVAVFAAVDPPDALTLTAERLAEAFGELARGRDVVFGPACDGGL